jgi:protein-arginine kinase activator protein McsA
MNFDICAKCKLSIPSHRLIPVFAISKGQKMRVKVCEHCKEEIDKLNKETK